MLNKKIVKASLINPKYVLAWPKRLLAALFLLLMPARMQIGRMAQEQSPGATAINGEKRLVSKRFGLTHILRVNQRRLKLTGAVVLSLGLSSCGFDSEGSDTELDIGTTRDFYMGFTTQPYDADADAVNDNYARIIDNGDIVTHRFENGIPWDNVVDDGALPTALLTDIQDREGRTTDKQIIVSLESLNKERNGIIGTWSEEGVIDSTAPWSNRGFSDENVVAAYSNYAKKLIEQFDADYFNYGEEISELLLNDSEAFDEFVIFADGVYNSIKADYPNVEVLFSIKLRSPSDENTAIIVSQIQSLSEYADIIGLSVFPYNDFSHTGLSDPENLPSDWLSQIRSAAGGKTLAITQTGWIAQTLSVEGLTLLNATEENQDEYMRLLLAEANLYDLAFVTWFSVVDYDVYWTQTLEEETNAAIKRDSGLFSEGLTARPALERWTEYLERDKN